MGQSVINGLFGIVVYVSLLFLSMEMWNHPKAVVPPKVNDVKCTFPSKNNRWKRYTINPLGYKWDHLNLTYNFTLHCSQEQTRAAASIKETHTGLDIGECLIHVIVQFPSTLNKDDTEKALEIAFRMWSNVSPLTFQRLPSSQESDLSIGFYAFNHSDCWSSPLHPCFDGPNGELAHAFLPPRGEIHFDNHEFWILGPSRFSWKQGCAAGSTCWLTQVQEKCNTQKTCHPKCHGCRETLDQRTTTHKVKVKMLYVAKGESVILNCTHNAPHPRQKISWYKNGSRLMSSTPGIIMKSSASLILQAQEKTKGRYTCVIRRGRRILGGKSWNLRII
ncbi:matrix metalloproteinase-23-like isoform X4 [Pyxicephalus adspersus]|uniref:matrix metalloproteinase-23-like isoform X4 n=1 Tax=Pyxicephalus adspersus TaxID=30357 RepID=UPI003B59C8F7